MENEIVNQGQEVQRVPYRINPRRNMPRHILIKLTKTKHKERILKAAREKQHIMLITLQADALLSEPPGKPIYHKAYDQLK